MRGFYFYFDLMSSTPIKLSVMFLGDHKLYVPNIAGATCSFQLQGCRPSDGLSRGLRRLRRPLVPAELGVHSGARG